MHMKDTACNVHLQFMDGLPAPTIQHKSCQLFCPVINIAMSNNFKHSHVHFIQFYINKARFIHTSTAVTRLHSCPGKKYAYALRASCFYIETNIFEHFLRQNIQQKVLAYHSVHAPNPVAIVQIQYYIILRRTF